MDIILDYYEKNKSKYLDLEKKIKKNIKGRICHNNVLVLNILCELYNINNYLEIGVHNGASLSYVVSSQKNIKKCIGIDLFENTFGHYLKDNITYENTLNNIKSNNKNNEIFLIKGNSQKPETENELRKILNNIDLLFIDGDHSYEGIQNDFLIYEKFVNKNGFIVLDDYCDKYPGIIKFVDLYIQKNNNYSIIGVFKNNELILQKLV